MAITIPELNSVSVVDDTDNIMLTHSNGNSEKISGSAFKADMIKNKIENNNGHAVSVNAVSTIMATSTTITGPELGTGGNIKILFTSAIAGSDTSTGLSLTYNGNTIAVKVGKDGALVDFCAYEVSTGVYRYLQAYTTLEMVYDGTQFIIVGNPNIDNVPTENSSNPVKSSGLVNSVPVNEVTSNNMHAVTSNAVANALSYSDTEHVVGKYYNNTLYARTFIYNNITSNIGQGALTQSNFPILQSKTVKIELTRMMTQNPNILITGGFAYLVDQNLYIYQEISSDVYTVIITVYYIK